MLTAYNCKKKHPTTWKHKTTQTNLLWYYCAQPSVQWFLLLFPAYALGLASAPSSVS